MEEVLQKLEGVAVDEYKDPKSNFEDLYKNQGKFSNQEERRKEILDAQKKNRCDKVDKFRGIFDIVNGEDISDNRNLYKPTVYVAGFMRRNLYKNVLMLSEWMVEKPCDFEENWFVVPCPKGKRMLVVASKGVTSCYTKHGLFRFKNHTALPGGNPLEAKGKRRCCILDCFYDLKTNTMFVLDLLAWNNLPMTDGEMEFRNFWLNNNLTEIPELFTITKRNQMKFSLLPKVPCTRDSFNEFMMKHPYFENNHPVLDGLLFFHKQARYVAGETPLVGWLYPFMVNEILGSDITLHDVYIQSKPANYVNQVEYMKMFDLKHNKRKGKQQKIVAMDVAAEGSDHSDTEVSPVSKQMECNATSETKEATPNEQKE